MSATQYRHSETFARLKGVQESIKVNLTSFQYLSVLDSFLYKSIQPLVQCTRFMDVFLAQMLAWQTQNPKRKTSGAGRHSFAANATLFFLSEDPKARLKILRNMRLDRAILFEAIRRWLAIVAEYEALSEQIGTPERMEHLHELHERASMRSSFSLHSTYSQVKFYHDQASAFKAKILEKYTRLCLNTAQRDYVQLNHRIELEVIIQVYMLVACKAIDKCDTEKGVLTSHIQNWLLSAKNVVMSEHLQKTMVSMSAAQGRAVEQIAEHVSLDEVPDMPLEDSEAYEKEELIDNVRLIAKAFDPSGTGRILMGIHEVLTDEDKMAVRAMAVPLEVNKGTV
jgi:hypothetical protein